VFAQRFQFGHVDLFDVGEVRNGALRLAHALSAMSTAQADDFGFGRISRVSPALRRVRVGGARRGALQVSAQEFGPRGPEPATVVRVDPRFAGEAP